MFFRDPGHCIKILMLLGQKSLDFFVTIHFLVKKKKCPEMSRKNGHLLENGNIWKHLETFGNPIHISMRIILANNYFNKYGNPKGLKMY
jgi:hypothetical protein